MKNLKLHGSIFLCLFLISCSINSDNIKQPVAVLTIQERLDSNETPLDIYESGILLNDIYGNFYEGGFIFYLDTDTGKGMVTGFQDTGTTAGWSGCFYPNVTTKTLWSGQDNTFELATQCENPNYPKLNPITVCTSLDLNGHTDWFLPSTEEIAAMLFNLGGKDYISFGASHYWSSSNIDSQYAWAVDNMLGLSVRAHLKRADRNQNFRVRAIRYF